ncbi:MAG TPA: DoxX family membrane protein [Polyangiaceae bacterium]|nr:DoxX family membrane protein [Polyangiaceae bacterium]
MATHSQKVWWKDPSVGLDVIRIYLGVGLTVRGALFISRPEVLIDFMNRGDSWFVPLALSQYVVAAHLCGGILLALGLGTRLAAVVQIPPLLGAVLLVHMGEGLLTAGQSLEFAALVLAMLGVFSIFGSGRVSLEAWLAKRNAETQGELADVHHLREVRDQHDSDPEHVHI